MLRLVAWPPTPDDGGSKHLLNVGQYLPDYTAQHPTRQPSSEHSKVYKMSSSIFLLLWMIMSGPEREDVTEIWKKLHMKEIHNLCLRQYY
jgi:hypothetical protein